MMIYDRDIALFYLPETFFALSNFNLNIYVAVKLETTTKFKIIAKHRSFLSLYIYLYLFDLTLCAKDIHIHLIYNMFWGFLCSLGELKLIILFVRDVMLSSV